MDRRGFLRGAMGVGVATAAAKLWLPPISTALAQPERRVFLPPSGGWWADDPYQEVWRTNETALDFIDRYSRFETTYDVETFGDVPSEMFLLRPSDTVKVIFGPEQQAGVMVVQQIDHYDTGWIRIRGVGVESFIGSHLNPPLGTINARRGTVEYVAV